MKTLLSIRRMHRWFAAMITAIFALPLAGYSATIIQTVDCDGSTYHDWNATIWGGGEFPVSGNDYVTASGLRGAIDTHIGAPQATGLLRFYDDSFAFDGDSVTLVTNTEFLIKATTGIAADANITFNGGDIRLAADGGAAHFAAVTGTLHVASEAWIGVSNPEGSTLTIASAVTGTNVLHVGFGQAAGIVRFTGDLSGFGGTLELGGGDVAGTLDFGQDYNNTNITFSLLTSSSDFINLTNDITFLALNWGTNSLPVGTYTAGEINDAYLGNGIQFTGTNGSLTVVTAPYPAPQPPPNTNLVVQLANAGSSDSWNGPAIWGGQFTAPDKDYFSSSSLYGSAQGNHVGYDGILGRIRALATDTNFNGNSLTLVDNTELLVKGTGGFTNTCADLIVDGALIRYSPDSASSAVLAGGLTVATNSMIGIEQTGLSTYTIASTLHGSGDLTLRAGRTSHILAFSGDLSDYTGNLVVEGGEFGLTLDLNQNYDLPDVGLTMEYNTNRVHVLQLDDQTIKLGSFTFGTNSLPAGSAYTAAQLDSFFGTTNQFTGATGTLEIYGAGGPTVDPVITDISVSGSTVTLSWTDEGVGTYSIQHKTNLTDAVWSDVATGLPAGLGTTNVTASSAATEFFQIKGE